MGCAPTKATHHDATATTTDSSTKRTADDETTLVSTPEKATSVVPVAKNDETPTGNTDDDVNRKENANVSKPKREASKGDSEPVKDDDRKETSTSAAPDGQSGASQKEKEPSTDTNKTQPEQPQEEQNVPAKKEEVPESKPAPVAPAPAPPQPAPEEPETKKEEAPPAAATETAADPAKDDGLKHVAIPVPPAPTTTTSDTRTPSRDAAGRRSPQAQGGHHHHHDRHSSNTTPTSHQKDSGSDTSVAATRPPAPQPMTLKVLKGQVVHGFEVTQVTDSKGYTVISTISSRTKVDTIARWADRVKRSQDAMGGKLQNPQLIARQEKKQSMASLNGSHHNGGGDRSQSPSMASMVSTTYSQSSNTVHLNATSNSLAPGGSSVRGTSAVGSSMAPYGNESGSMRVVPSACPTPSSPALGKGDTELSFGAGGAIPSPTTAALPKVPDQ